MAVPRRPDGPGALPRLLLCQNTPFTPIHDAWHDGGPGAGDPPDAATAERFRRAIRQVHADELTNWAPPFGVRGGVRDVLAESRGDVLAAGNAEVRAAREAFAELEGIDIDPPPAWPWPGCATRPPGGGSTLMPPCC